MNFHPFFSMAFNLTDEQEQFFKTVLMYINNERKSALIQLLDSKEAKTIAQVSRDFMDYPNADPHYLPKQNVLSIFKKALSPLELAVEETVVGDSGREAKAFRLTEKGEQVKRYAGFALERMAREFDQSIYPILGTMNSTYGRVRPEQAVALLYLVNQAPLSLQKLAENTSLTDRSNIDDILKDLSSFKDAQGNPMPLIRINSPKLEEGVKGYQWVKGSPTPTTTSLREKWKKLVQVLSSDPERVWTVTKLMKECRYGSYTDLSPRLERLESIGNVQSGFSRELTIAYLTDHGKRFIYSLFEPIKGAIAGDEVSKGIIDRNHPTPNNVVRVLGLYVRIKDRERAISLQLNNSNN